MKLRAQIVVDINAEDYVAAAEHQRSLEELLTRVRAHYPNAQLSIRERRQRAVDGPVALDSQLITMARARVARRS